MSILYFKKLIPFFFCIAIISCSDDSSSSNSTGSISINSLVENQIIDGPIQIALTLEATDPEVEVFIDDNLIYSTQGQKQISFDFDPESISTGSHLLRIQMTSSSGKLQTKEVNFIVQRRLIKINLPKNILNQYNINAVAFASKMDGTLISAKLFTNHDESISLSSPDEFSDDEEFMLTFALTDNGSANNISTHANLTRNNPGVINLTKPFRGEEGDKKTYNTNGFATGDYIHSGNINTPYNSDYRIDFDATANTFTLNIIDDIDGDDHSPEIFYLYYFDSGSYFHRILYPPLPDNFVLEKDSFTYDGIASQSMVFNSTHSPNTEPLFMKISGYWTANDFAINNFQTIYHRNLSVEPGRLFNYHLNQNFYEYRYYLQYQDYYAAGIGMPKSEIHIPNNTLDFAVSLNKIDFDITGTDHIIGRIRLNDNGNFPIYVWDITFNSKTTTSFILPELPAEMVKSNLLNLYRDNLLKVKTTELVSYRGIEDYDEYLQKVVKNHVDPLKVSDGQELIFSTKEPFHDGPILGFNFR